MKKNKSKGNLIYILLTCLFLCTGAFSAYKLIDYYIQAKRSADEFKALRPVTELTVPKRYTPGERYGRIYESNEDFIGWITIEGTQVDYPVMQTKKYPNFYLRRNFEGKYSYYGVPYLDEACTIGESDNFIIYSHNMKNGTMFSAVEDYSKYSFYEEHPIIHFDTLDEFADWQVVYACRVDLENTDFDYSGVAIFPDEERFDDFIKNIANLSAYKTEVDIEYGDTLLTLSTCEYTHDNGRFVVVAKKIDSYTSRVYDRDGNIVHED